MNQGKLLVVIPAHNEEESLETTVRQLMGTVPGVDFVVVNDGSTDATGEICRSRGFRCIDLPVNVGLSHAIKCGMVYANNGGYSYVLQFDADGQHDARYISEMLEQLQHEDCDIVIGSRFLAQPMPLNARTIGARILSALIRLVSGQRLTDPTSGMRMYSSRMIRLFAVQTNMNPEPDTLSYLIKCGVRVKELPVVMHERQGGKSMFSLVSSVEYMVRTAFSLCFVQVFRKKDGLI